MYNAACKLVARLFQVWGEVTALPQSITSFIKPKGVSSLEHCKIPQRVRGEVSPANIFMQFKVENCSAGLKYYTLI